MKVISPFFATLMGTLLVSSVAHATTIDFTISEGPSTEATGSFSYTTSSTNLSYGDLTAFSLTVSPSTNYGLSFVQSSTNYDYFNFDTVTNTFVPGDASGTYGDLGPFLLAAVSSDFSSGFDFFSAPRNDFSEFTQNIYDLPYDTVSVVTVPSESVSLSSVPEPSSLPTLLAWSRPDGRRVLFRAQEGDRAHLNKLSFRWTHSGKTPKSRWCDNAIGSLFCGDA